MSDLIDAISISDVGLGGLVTIGIILIFWGRLVPYVWVRELVKQRDAAVESSKTKDEAINHLVQQNDKLLNQLTPVVNQILGALPIPHDEEKR